MDRDEWLREGWLSQERTARQQSLHGGEDPSRTAHLSGAESSLSSEARVVVRVLTQFDPSRGFGSEGRGHLVN